MVILSFDFICSHIIQQGEENTGYAGLNQKYNPTTSSSSNYCTACSSLYPVPGTGMSQAQQSLWAAASITKPTMIGYHLPKSALDSMAILNLALICS